jgi:glyceraldehyde 3-phosphate dehydrogenase
VKEKIYQEDNYFMSIKVGINGFGRIGRMVVRAALKKNSDIDFIAVNDLTDPKTLAHLFKYDSVIGNFDGTVDYDDNSITINGKKIKVWSERNVENLKWKDAGVDVVIESTGLFRKRKDAIKHIESGGAKKVIISAPATEPDNTICMGINEETYDPANHNIISNASCTTNCLAPLAKVLKEEFGIVQGLMTTIHSYTNDQKILDSPHKDLRRARAAAVSMIPTTTGAAKALALVIPEVKGKFTGMAIRVPTPNVSLVDLTVELEKNVSKDEINAAMKKWSENKLKGILAYTEEELVSWDFRGNENSAIFDAPSTYVVEKDGNKGNFVKVLGWYDNEYGYSCRVIDLTEYIGKKL